MTETPLPGPSCRMCAELGRRQNKEAIVRKGRVVGLYCPTCDRP